MTALFLIAVACIPVWAVGGAVAALTMDSGPEWLTVCARLASRGAAVVGIGAAVFFALAYGVSLLPWHIEIGAK
ncbi:hypothetical protein [Nocardia wallacei]|uniref:hypothetical protein n=1 Tax=Nocardia wallacei TaxID=480035 RepID=UPI0024572A2F|nr:hypothetical protein [Nocardia wallacei]